MVLWHTKEARIDASEDGTLLVGVAAVAKATSDAVTVQGWYNRASGCLWGRELSRSKT